MYKRVPWRLLPRRDIESLPQLILCMPAPDKQFQVAIIGGGVCGLTCTLGLLKYGVSVQIYEAAVQSNALGRRQCADNNHCRKDSKKLVRESA